MGRNAEWGESGEAGWEILCYGNEVTRMKNLLMACLGGVLLLAAIPVAAVGQEPGPDLESNVMSTPPPTPPAETGSARSFGSRFGWLWFSGAVAFYFALQLWILPKMGVPT